LLAKLLWLNLETGASEYEQLHFSHSRVPHGHAYVHLFRPALPTMVSQWKVREHAGVAASVTFGDMLRVPWFDLPISTNGGGAVFNGAPDNRVCVQRIFHGTALDRWLEYTLRFAASAALNVNYYDVVRDPEAVVRDCAHTLHFGRKRTPFARVEDRVGWWVPGAVDPRVTDADLELIEQYQQKLEAAWQS